MSFYNRERVYTGNSIESAPTIGTVNYNAEGLLQFINVEGPMFKIGDLVFGEDSGYSGVITSADETIDIITGQPYGQINFITLDTGEAVALDAYFTNTSSQNYQTTFIVVPG